MFHSVCLAYEQIKKALDNNVRPKFVQKKRQLVHRHEHIQAERKLMLSHLSRHVCNLKIQIKTHYDLYAFLALSISEIRYKLFKKHLLSSLYQERTTSFNTKTRN